MNKLPRKTTVVARLDGSFNTFDNLILDDTGLHVYKDKLDIVNETGVEVSFLKKNGKEKLISRIDNVDLKSEDFLSMYNVICVADTNTKFLQNRTISISCFMIGQKISNNEYEFDSYVIAWDSCNIDKPENYAWCVLVDKVKEIIGTRLSKIRVLLVVDSDLGNHDAFNSRKLPLFANYYLPKNFEITYASADKNSQLPLNNLIQKCDYEANEYYNEIKNTQL